MKLKTLNPPAGLLEKLSRLQLEYSTPEALFHGVWTCGDTYCGVFGDGDNGAYEWFIYRADTGELQHSNVGYGSTGIALMEVLEQEKAVL